MLLSGLLGTEWSVHVFSPLPIRILGAGGEGKNPQRMHAGPGGVLESMEGSYAAKI